jgi:hypothetical protein
VILILDTNAMFSRPELRGVRWNAVKNAVTEGTLTVIVPRVVVAELAGRTREERAKCRPSTRLVHNAPPAVLAAFENATEQVDLWAQNYDAEAIMRDAGFTIVPTPAVDHDALSQRAIDRLAPFDEKGGGYRDALHWHSVLEQIHAHPDEQIVFMSNDAGFRSSRDSRELDPYLVSEVAEILRTGTFALALELSDFEVPGKYAGDSADAEITDQNLAELLADLFVDGKLRTPDLWEAMVGREEALDADLSDPEGASVTFAVTRPLVNGGAELYVGIRLTADVLFDWDYPDEASRQTLEITARFALGTDGNLVRGTADDVTAHPVPVRPHETPADREERPSRSPGSATGWAFDRWLYGDIGKTMGLPATDVLSGLNITAMAQAAGIAAGMLSTSEVLHKAGGAAAAAAFADAVRPGFATPVIKFLPVVPPVIKAVTAYGLSKRVATGITGALGTPPGRTSQPSKPFTAENDGASSSRGDTDTSEDFDPPAS